MMMLGQLERPTATLALGALLHDVGKPATYSVSDRIRFNGHAEVGAAMTAKLLNRLKLPNELNERVTSLVANHMRFKDVFQMRVSTLKRFLSLPHFDEHLELHRLDCLCSNGYTDSYEFVRQKLDEFSHEELRPTRLLTGRDLIAAGYRPGPEFGPALESVETAQLEGEVSTREQALARAQVLLDRAEE